MNKPPLFDRPWAMVVDIAFFVTNVICVAAGIIVGTSFWVVALNTIGALCGIYIFNGKIKRFADWHRYDAQDELLWEIENSSWPK